MNSVQNTWILGKMKSHRRLRIQEFNEIISCYLCHGYLINPTTIDSCMHSYCRSCIVQYLQNDKYCPQCKLGGGKHISYSNLKSDEALRCLVYKLVPGLYQQERERLQQFNNSFKPEEPEELQEPIETSACETDDEFFSTAEPISLSLEYHPALLASCDKDEIPPVRYLQCPAGVMIHHLKRFLCSKYDIDPENKLVEIEVIYEEEVLPNDFTLMDVGYCYNWNRNGPMRFTYRILIHSGTTQDIAEIQSNTEANMKNSVLGSECTKSSTTLLDAQSNNSRKSVRFVEEKSSLSAKYDNSLPPPMTYTVFKSKAQEHRLGALNNNNNKTSNATQLEKEFDENMLNDGNGPVKVIIARKPTEGKKSSPKRSHLSEEVSYVVTNDFKSLRSNDLRYSDYTVTSTTNSNSTSKSKQKSTKNTDTEALSNQVSKCDIVVCIPQSQIPRSPNSSDENVSLSQLKTANKKSPTSSDSIKTKNVPKLKIELGSLKTKITIPKPKSADAGISEPQHKKSKHRKYSVDEYGPTTDKVDLETYVKNIGLKPIEVVTAPESLDTVEKDKCSPDASPMSSSSSTTSSSNGNFIFTSSSEITSSSHKKRKKKHSRDSKDSNGKRRKLHAEISSQPADESLKMKVKITPSHIHKAHKTESRKTLANKMAGNSIPKTDSLDKTVLHKESNSDLSKEELKIQNNNNNVTINMSSLNKTLSEESLNISNLIIGQKIPSSSEEPPKIMTTIHSNIGSLTNPIETSTLSPKPFLPKPISHIKDLKIPSSPPLPPSLFKTTPLTLTTSTAPAPSSTVKTSPNSVPSFTSKPAQKAMVKPSSPVQPQGQNAPGIAKNNNGITKTQNFAIPNPPRSMPNSPKLCSLPTSIASAAHKQMGAQLKRSASLDESHPPVSLAKQQEKLMRKTAYGSAAISARSNSVSQKECSAQKTKSLEKSFYSPLSSSYTQEVSYRKSVPMNTPPSSTGVTKMKESYSIYTNPRMSTQPALTITTHPKQTAAQQMINFLPYAPLNKPALEIVRIASNQVPADKLTQPPISPPRNVRPAQPPIPLLKIKKPGQQTVSTPTSPTAVSTTTLKSPSTAKQSPPAFINMRNTIPLSVATKATAAKEVNARVTEGKSNGNTLQDKQKASLRDFRPTSKDGSVEILDLSANKSQDTHKPSTVQTTIGNSLEAALNKIKQNITSCTATDSLQSSKLNASKGSADDLQNLHLLSESATNREKLAIKPQQKMFEMSKTQQPTVVRQQNASVRNIPNPSALAFRNQPVLSMLASIASPPSSQYNPTTTTSPSDVKTLSPPSLFASSPKSPNAANQTSPRTKKLTSIDQVAANLNMRAAAAEASAAKAASSEESSLVSSTSTGEHKSAAATKAITDAAIAREASSAKISSTTSVSATTTATSTAVTAITSADSAKILTTSTVAQPTMPKTSFKSISSLVASPSVTPSAVASSV